MAFNVVNADFFFSLKEFFASNLFEGMQQRENEKDVSIFLLLVARDHLIRNYDLCRQVLLQA